MEQAEENRKDIILTAVASIVRELIDTSSSSSESDEELEIVQRYTRKREHVPRVENYVEITVPAFTDEQFKAHFRYCNTTSIMKISFIF